MKERSGFESDPLEVSWKGVRRPVPAASFRYELRPPHLDQVRRALQILRKEFESLLEEYLRLQERILKLEENMETFLVKGEPVFGIQESSPDWRKTPSEKKEPVERRNPGRADPRPIPVRILSVILNVDLEGAQELLSLLQEGFLCETDREQSLSAFLREKLGLGNRGDLGGIDRVFLDEKPVCDIEKTTLAEGSVLTVFCSPPEEAGSSRPWQFSPIPMKEEPSRTGETGSPGLRATGLLRLKLCGSLPRNSGILILQKGVLIEGDRVDAFFSGRQKNFFLGMKRLRISGEEQDPGSLGRGGLACLCDWVHLVVRIS